MQVYEHYHSLRFGWWVLYRYHLVWQTLWNILQYQLLLYLNNDKNTIKPVSLRFNTNITFVNNHEIRVSVFIYFTDAAQQETNTRVLKRKQPNVNVCAQDIFLFSKIEKIYIIKGRVSRTFIVYNYTATTLVTKLTSSPITAKSLPLTAECIAIFN